MVAGEVNGSDVCAIMEKEERVCCPDTDKSAAGSKEKGGALVEVPESKWILRYLPGTSPLSIQLVTGCTLFKMPLKEH
jgi:hypothetical protein